MRYVIFYGSFKRYGKRSYNFNRFVETGEQLYIRDIELDGYEMYDLNGHYPAICVGSGRIKAELHNVSDGLFDKITKLELNAGYKSLTFQLDNDINATIYIMDKNKLSKYPKVESGNWE